MYTGRFPQRFGYEFTPIPKIMAQIQAIFSNPMESSRQNLFQPIYHSKRAHLVPDMINMAVPINEKFISEILQQEYNYNTFFIGKVF